MQVQRDYGTIKNQPFPNNTFNVSKNTLVYLATHDGEGQSLPYMNRSFISFKFGGKSIEEFNLIATITSNSLNREGYASFNDITSSYDNLDGLYYWKTHHNANSISFVLATDGIDLRLLDNFLLWFRAGETKELILSEHPNRMILARVAQPPHLDLLPFEDKVEFKVSNYSYTTSTTLYKGTISLEFVMDRPYWESLDNILGKKEGDVYVDKWDDANGQEVSIFASLDALKILYEDNIPLGSAILTNMLLGNGAVANVEDNISQCIWDPNSSTQITNIENLTGGGACIDGTVGGVVYKGIIAGAIINASGNGIESLTKNESAYFYYSGNAPAPATISFKLTPTINSNGYISSPANSYANVNGLAYSVLTIESVNLLKLYFTTPNVYTSFNKVIDILRTNVTSSTTKSWEDVRLLIREEVRHPYVRAYAVGLINSIASDIKTYNVSNLITNMLNFLKDGNQITSATFVFNSETGKATGTFLYKINNTLTIKEEDVGDMLRSNYIMISDRNYPTSRGEFTKWTSAHKEYSHKITHNALSPLENFIIQYKNMYL